MSALHVIIRERKSIGKESREEDKVIKKCTNSIQTVAKK